MVSPAIKAVVCDIEGTTTSISFVKDILFVYAKTNLESFLDQSWDDEATQSVVELLRAESKVDVESKTEGSIEVAAADADKAKQIESLLKSVQWQMGIDRKATPLKTLQGLIWAKAYKDGSIKGHVYEDVPKAFDTWTASGVKIYIYSSGSVDAQKLLFGHTEHGDLLAKLSGHYDTKIGTKQESQSYANIVKELDVAANEVLFLTDIVGEAKAAIAAGLKSILLDRPGNAPFSSVERSEYTVVTSFDDISLDVLSSVNKRKLIDEEVTAEPEVRPAKQAKIDETEKTPTEIKPVSVVETSSTASGDSAAASSTTVDTVAVVQTDKTNGTPAIETPMETSEATVSKPDAVDVQGDNKAVTKKTEVDESDEPKIIENSGTESMEVDDAVVAPAPVSTAPKNGIIETDQTDKVVENIEVAAKEAVTDVTKTKEVNTDKEKDNVVAETAKVDDVPVAAVKADDLKTSETVAAPVVEPLELTATEISPSEPVKDDTKSPAAAPIVMTNGKDATEIEVAVVSIEEKPVVESKTIAEKDHSTNTAADVQPTTNGSNETAKDLIIPVGVEKTDAMDSKSEPAAATITSTSETSEVTETSTADDAKQKVSRVEITIEQIDNQAGQTTQTTTHIVKEITIKEQLVVSPSKSEVVADNKKISIEPTRAAVEVIVVNGQNGDLVAKNSEKKEQHSTAQNGKDMVEVDVSSIKSIVATTASDDSEKSGGHDSDKENDVSTNGGDEHPAATEVVLKKCLDTNKPIESASGPEVTA